MNNEIKEILDELKDYVETSKKETSKYKDGYIIYPTKLGFKPCIKLLDYITNLQQIEKDHQKLNGELREEIKKLQEENEDLREDNYAYHQLMKIQNKREYRSKFLKEFQEEFGTNVFPDYDEIYKRYDKLKKENEKLKQSIVILENYLELIHDLGYDYDGLKYEYELKGLIDEMVRFSSLGRAYNTTEEIYVDGKGKSFNILGEELKENK